MEQLYLVLDDSTVQALAVAGLSWFAVYAWKRVKQIPANVRVPEKRIGAVVGAVTLAVFGEWVRISNAPAPEPYEIGRVIVVALPAVLGAFGLHNLTKKHLPSRRIGR